MRFRPSLLLFTVVLLTRVAFPAQAQSHWYKGNLHTHSLWSDGDDYPEMISAWYKEHGYQFLAISDHNTLQNRERWVSIAKNPGVEAGFKRYLERFGSDWVQAREAAPIVTPKAVADSTAGTADVAAVDPNSPKLERQVRLRKLDEYRPLLEAAGKFLLIQCEEITAKNIHINATNLQELILPYTAFDPQDSAAIVSTMQRTLNAVADQRMRTGVPMFPHINHPNFKWAITAEELAQLDNEQFFEVYNGHPDVRNAGDAAHASTDRIWDIILTERLGQLGKAPMFGLGTDDSHHYQGNPLKKSRPGRGWVMVRAKSLTTDALLAALEAGDFYASSGVTLRDVQRDANQLSVEIEAEPGVTYTTEFFGTLRDYDPKSQPVLDESGKPVRTTRTYSSDVGALLTVVQGTSATYRLTGDELYVRARITSSKLKADPSEPGEYERAWTQPLVNGR